MELNTERLLLREFVLEDHEAVHRYAADPEVTRFMDWGPNDIEATRVFLQEAIGSADSYPRSRYPLAVVRRDLDELIGFSRASGDGRARPSGRAWLRSRPAKLGKWLCHQVFARDEWRDRLLFAAP